MRESLWLPIRVKLVIDEEKKEAAEAVCRLPIRN